MSKVAIDNLSDLDSPFSMLSGVWRLHRDQVAGGLICLLQSIGDFEEMVSFNRIWSATDRLSQLQLHLYFFCFHCSEDNKHWLRSVIIDLWRVSRINEMNEITRQEDLLVCAEVKWFWWFSNCVWRWGILAKSMVQGDPKRLSQVIFFWQTQKFQKVQKPNNFYGAYVGRFWYINTF